MLGETCAGVMRMADTREYKLIYDGPPTAVKLPNYVRSTLTSPAGDITFYSSSHFNAIQKWFINFLLGFKVEDVNNV